MAVEQVIVYRSMYEAQMDQMLMNGSIFPVIAGVASFFFTFVFLHVFWNFIRFHQPVGYDIRKRRRKQGFFNPAYVQMTIAGCVGVYVAWSMWL